MSRNILRVTEHITAYHGSDHALGSFVDIIDDRYAGHQLDVQGEGYVMEYSTRFGFGTNLIGATVEDLQTDNGVIIAKVNKFIESLPPRTTDDKNPNI